MFLFEPQEKAIIFGNGEDLINANYWKKKENTAWIVIEDAWKIRRKNNDWDRIICTKEFLEKDEELLQHIKEIPQRWGDCEFLYLFETFRKMYDTHLHEIVYDAFRYTQAMYDPKKIGYIGCEIDTTEFKPYVSLICLKTIDDYEKFSA